MLRRFIQVPPALGVIILLFLAQHVALLGLGLARGELAPYVKGYAFGYDFEDIQIGGRDLAEGRDPYLKSRFNKPPLVAELARPLAPLGRESAIAIGVAANLAGIGFALWAACRRFGQTNLLPALVVLSALVYPTHFLLHRTNVDGLAMAGMGMMLWAPESALLAGLGLAFGFAVKIYPAILAVPLILARRLSGLAVAAAATALMIAATSGLWPPFLAALESRGSKYGIVENASAFSIFELASETIAGTIGNPSAGERWSIVGIISTLTIYGVSLAVSLFADLRAYRPRWSGTGPGPALDEECARLILYIPFALALPLLVYPYALVLLLLLVPVFFWVSRHWGACRLYDGVFLAGLLLAGTEATALADLAGRPWLHALPSAGLVLFMGWACLIKVRLTTVPIGRATAAARSTQRAE
jgi:glycosyl transferase family 87